MLLFIRPAKSIIYIILNVCTYFPYIIGFKLSSSNVLLNYLYDLPTTYELTIRDASHSDCFEWSTTDASVVTVIPVFESFENCSKKAILSSVAYGNERRVTRITASHYSNDTSIKLYCDVISDVIKAIELRSSTNEVILNGPPLSIIVEAKNSLGHTFSSVNGIHFNFSTSCESSETIRLLRFSESSYSPLEIEDPWEIRGLFSNSVLIEGVAVGNCTISSSTVHFQKTHFEMLSSPPFSVHVSPDLKIHPSTSFHMLKHSYVNVSLSTVQGNAIVDHHDIHASSSKSDVVRFSEDLLCIHGENLGDTELTYKSLSEKFPEVKIEVQVVEPESLELEISRGGFTTLEEMKSYVISVKIHSNSGTIIPSDNIRIKVTFPSKLFHVNKTTENGSYYFVQTLAPGSGIIKAEYKGVILQNGSLKKSDPLFTSVKVKVVHKLQIYPPFVLLPSDIPLHEITLKVSGGSKSYTWGLHNNSAASITVDKKNSDTAKVVVHKESHFKVSVSDKSNVNFLATAYISVQPIIDIEVYPTVVEAEVKNTLLLPVALLGYAEKKIIRKFDDCSKINLTVEIVEKNVLTYDDEPYIPAFGKGCLTLQFRCKSPGHSRVNVFHASNTVHKTTTVLSCFKLLRPLHPVRVAVLALGTSKEIAFEGGPRKWPLYKEGHYTKLEASNPNLVNIDIIKDPVRYNRDLAVFRVFCKSLGETVLLFHIGNEPSATLPHPAKAETSVMLVCSEPHSVHLKLHKKNTKKENHNIVKVPFYGEKQFAVDLWVKDSVGRKFSNISSLKIEFEVSDESLAEPVDGFNCVTTHENAVAGYRKVSRDFKEFKMTGKTGDLKVTAKVTRYNGEVLSKNDINVPELKEISNHIDLKLISLRDMTAELYPNGKKAEENFCDGDSCKS